ncbi:hypothetical protein [uncultured Celeribacter sp.]|nr:hypothetical protein [uncultured Celeribacter sp.]
MREFFDRLVRLHDQAEQSFEHDLIGGIVLFVIVIAGLSYGGHP